MSSARAVPRHDQPRERETGAEAHDRTYGRCAEVHTFASDVACAHSNSAAAVCDLPVPVPAHCAPVTSQVADARRDTGKLSLDLDTVSLLFFMPFLSMLTCAYMYASLPLYFLDQSQSGHSWFTLTKLGLILLTGNVVRVLLNVATNKLGDTVYLVQLCAALATSLWMLIDPESVGALVISMILATSSNYILALQGLAFSRFYTNGSKELHVRALRVLTTMEVIGYSVATVVGGVLYDFGGWRLCVWLQNGCMVLMLLCSLGAPTVRHDCRLWVRKIIGNFGVADAGTSSTASKVDSEKSDMQKSSAEGEQLAMVPPLDCWPVLLVLAAHSTNAASYTVEWSVFAAFFREEFGWSSSWAGATQSSGDLLAAAFLLLQAFSSDTKQEPSVQDAATKGQTGSDDEVGPIVGTTCTALGCARLWFSYPLNLSALLLVTAALDFTIAQPSFICAVVAQVRHANTRVFAAVVEASTRNPNCRN